MKKFEVGKVSVRILLVRYCFLNAPPKKLNQVLKSEIWSFENENGSSRLVCQMVVERVLGVVGAGINGTFAALHLAKRGHNTVLIEQVLK